MILIRFRRLKADQAGAVIVIYAIMMTILLGVLALVIDLAQVRAERRLDKAMADSAVRAGLGILQAGPWLGICRSENYLLDNSQRFNSWDTNSQNFYTMLPPSVTTIVSHVTNPCLSPPSPPQLCLPFGALNNTSWGQMVATAAGGRFHIEVDSGYWMPDPRFPEDNGMSDNGGLLMGGCDNLAVIITEQHPTLFSGVLGMKPITTVVRSVGRFSVDTSGQYNPAVLLLEPHGCGVLTVSGSGTRLISQPYGDHPGIIQIDSADDQGGCASNQAVLNGSSTNGGPSIMVCSATNGIAPMPPVAPGCNAAVLGVTETAFTSSRVGIYALNWSHPSSDYVTTAFSTNMSVSTYGDTSAVRSAQAGRGPVDAIYRLSIQALDQKANNYISGNSGMPPGCTSVVANTCTGNGVTWLVLQQADCNALATTFSALLHPTWAAMANIYFNCNLNVAANNSPLGGLLLTGLNGTIVVTGTLSVSTLFSIADANNIFVGGTQSGSAVGLSLGNGSNFNVNNPLPGTACPPAAGLPHYTAMVVGNGSFNMSSSAADHLCQTMVYMANGFNNLPSTNGTGPCTCSGTGFANYTGYVSISSGSQVDWTAPNLIAGARATAQQLATITPFEGLALWTEAGGNNTNSINGGGNSQMTGVFFMPNANTFTLAGGSGANVYLGAQFIARTMKVTGGGIIDVTLNPFDTVPFVFYDIYLVR